MDVNDQLLKQAMQFHSSGNIDQAEKLYQQILAHDPDHGDANNFLGILNHQCGKSDIGTTLIAKAIKNFPDRYAYHVNLGVIYEAQEKLAEAETSYENALSLSDKNADIMFNLANVYKKSANHDKASAAYLEVIKIQPDHAGAYYNLGNNYALQAGTTQSDSSRIEALEKAAEIYEKCLTFNSNDGNVLLNLGNVYERLGQKDKAQASFEKATEVAPGMIEGYKNLAKLLKSKGENERAIQLYEKIIELEPDNSIASHMLAALKGGPIERVSEKYVLDLFNSYAETFDHHLVSELEYTIPELLQKEFLSLLGEKIPHFSRAMDLGCGTGLSGMAFRNTTDQLYGIDLSAEMLNKASQKGIYDHLIEGEISVLKDRPDRYDLFLACDVFIYIGEVSEVFDTVRKTAQTGAFFLFSVETCQDTPYILRQSGRVAHSRNYIEDLAATFGFTIRLIKETPIRKDESGWIPGEIYILEYTES